MNGNDPAFFNQGFEMPNHGFQWPEPGLSKRELFAAMAMQGFAACSDDFNTVERMAEVSVSWSDALIAELSKEGGDQ